MTLMRECAGFRYDDNIDMDIDAFVEKHVKIARERGEAQGKAEEEERQIKILN